MSERVFAVLIPGWPPGIAEEELRQDPSLADRLFTPVLTALEEVAPGAEPLQPGLAILRGRGVTRYYGGEEAAAHAILTPVRELGFTDTRIGIADGAFAATQAAHSTEYSPEHSRGVRIVPLGEAAAFLAPLPVSRAADQPLTDTLRGLGIRTLGQLAALPEHAVRDRFGPAGIAAHRRARAAPPAHGAEVRPRRPSKDFTVELDLDPPLGTSEQLAFACAGSAHRFVNALAEEQLVCTALRIELIDDTGVRHERTWAHPRHFTAADVVNRLRWQLEAMRGAAHKPAHESVHEGAGIACVRLTPAQTDRAAAHEPALWSAVPDERVHHHFTRVQSRLGHDEIGTAQLGGGRLLAERQQLVPWGTAITPRRPAHGPWPGTLTGPLPTTVFPTPLPADLRSRSGATVLIDDDDLPADQPDTLRVADAAPLQVSRWSLPWPLRELWWEGRTDRWRMQVQTASGPDPGSEPGSEPETAWLLVHQRGQWFAEGRYD